MDELLSLLKENELEREVQLVLASKEFFVDEDPDFFVHVYTIEAGASRFFSLKYDGKPAEAFICISFSDEKVSHQEYNAFENELSENPSLIRAKSWYGQTFILSGDPLSFLPNNLVQVRLKGNIDGWNDPSDREIIPTIQG